MKKCIYIVFFILLLIGCGNNINETNTLEKNETEIITDEGNEAKYDTGGTSLENTTIDESETQYICEDKPDFAEGNNDEIIDAYIAFVNLIGSKGENIRDGSGNEVENPVFYLEYINSDNIPEMIIKTEENIKSDYYILMYVNGEVKSNYILLKEHIDIVSGNNIVSAYTPHIIGYSYITYLFTEEGDFETACEYVETYTEESINKVNPLVSYYYVNSEEVTEEEYQVYFKDLLGTDKTIITIGGVMENGKSYPCTEEYLEKLCCGELY